MIALQVAAGIVLAYIILVNQGVFLKASKITGVALLILGAILLAIYSAITVWETVSTSISPALAERYSRVPSKLAMLPVIIAFVASAAVGGMYLSLVRYKLQGRTPPEEARPHSLLLWSIFNMAVTMSVLGLLSFTPLDIAGPVDNWSRSNGFKDLGYVLLVMSLLPWPLLCFWLLNRRRSKV